jgi:hypothetical protein
VEIIGEEIHNLDRLLEPKESRLGVLERLEGLSGAIADLIGAEGNEVCAEGGGWGR